MQICSLKLKTTKLHISHLHFWASKSFNSFSLNLVKCLFQLILYANNHIKPVKMKCKIPSPSSQGAYKLERRKTDKQLKSIVICTLTKAHIDRFKRHGRQKHLILQQWKSKKENESISRQPNGQEFHEERTPYQKPLRRNHCTFFKLL